MERRKPPRTKEGWYVLHEFLTVDWDAWREAPERIQEGAIEEGVEFLTACERVEDAEDGDSATFATLGHETDLLVMHVRPTMADLEALERRFERTAFAAFTERADSYVSVAEVSDYVTDAYFDDEDVESAGLARYLEQKLHPKIPDAEYVNFYPMEKRRDPEYNWYDLPYEDRSEHMSSHGDIGRSYGGKVSQITAASIGFDDYEWSVSLFANDPANIKNLLYEMRFDPSTSKYGEFGRFYVGRRFPAADLGAYMAGESVPRESEDTSTEGVEDELAALGVDLGPDEHAVVLRSTADPGELSAEVDGLRGNFDHYDTHLGTTVHEVTDGDGESAVVSRWETESAADIAEGFLAELPGVIDDDADEGHDDAGEGHDGAGSGHDGAGSGHDDRDGTGEGHEDADGAHEDGEVRDELEELGVYAGKPHGEDVHAVVLYSEADPAELFEEVDGLRGNFDHYDTHVKTAVYEADDAETAIVSLWETESAANTAAGFLTELPGIVRRAGEDADSWGTMGMFYTVKPEYCEEFVDTFEEVGTLLSGMDGHRRTDLLANREDENDMFIASRWDSREDAMAFFRSDAFSETVQWGREVLADRPRHVFLA